MRLKEPEPILPPVNRDLLRAELTPDRKVRDTHKAGNEIYIFAAGECPALMREVGRLREMAFRGAGGGTGREVDIDEEDLAGDGYYQLIVWDPAAEEIVGGYRFIICTSERPRHLSTEHYFRFSDRFRRKYLPRTIELGRSFVQPSYQARGNSKSIYALDNLWDGLGALIVLNPRAKYLFGKVTMYTSYKSVARNALIWFLRRYFPDREGLVEGIHPLTLDLDDPYYEELFCGETYMENYRILLQKIREFDENIPPLINAYMNLLTHDAGLRHGAKSRLRRCGGDRHSGHDPRHLPRETDALHPLAGVARQPQAPPRGVQRTTPGTPRADHEKEKRLIPTERGSPAKERPDRTRKGLSGSRTAPFPFPEGFPTR